MKTAVIGCGFQGRLHIESLKRLSDVEVVAVCDIDEARSSATAQEFGISHSYTDYRALIDAHALDLLTVCTMPNSHHEIVLTGLGAGANILCEKPFAMNATEATQMTAAASAADRLLAVGFNMRFMGSATAVRRFIDEGRLGTPICARGFMLADDVPWWGRHYVKEISGGGALAATAVHMLDLVRWLAGNPTPTTASASTTRVFPRKRLEGAPTTASVDSYNTEDMVFGHVRFENGFWMSIEGSWVWDRPGWNYGFDLAGDKAQASFDPLGFSGEEAGVLTALQAKAETDTDFPSSVDREIEDVVTALLEKRAPRTAADASEALVIQALVDALYRSAELGREVEVTVPDINAAPMSA